MGSILLVRLFILSLCLALMYDSIAVLADDLKQFVVVLKSPGFRASARKSSISFSTAARDSFKAGAVKKHRSLLQGFKGRKPVQDFTELANGFSARLTTSEANVLKDDPEVLFVSEDKPMKLFTYRSHDFLGLNKSTTGLWKKAKGLNTIVGIIDTGIWPQSESFADTGAGPIPSKFKGTCSVGNDRTFKCNRKLVGARYFGSSYASGQGSSLSSLAAKCGDYFSPRDINGHGTHVASTAAGAVATSSYKSFSSLPPKGAAFGARIAAYKVFWCDSGAYNGDINAALEAGVKDGVDVLSLSLGGGPDRPGADYNSMYYFAYLATLEGVPVVFAAGNDGPGFSTVANAVPWVMTVAASTTDNYYSEAPAMAYFSSRGPNGGSYNILKPDISAPGRYILAAWTQHKGASPWNSISGTSMATPHISGYIALLRALRPTWKPSMLFSALMTTATLVTNKNRPIRTDSGGTATPFSTGAGNVNPNAAADPGLVYPIYNSDYQKFLCSYDSALGYYYGLCTGTATTLAVDLNMPSISFYYVRTTSTQRTSRRLRNVGPSAVYTVTVVSPAGSVLQVTPTKLSFTPNKMIYYNVSVTPSVPSSRASGAVYAGSRYWTFGSITWKDNKGHSVRINVALHAY